jgi:hypothetical protein
MGAASTCQTLEASTRLYGATSQQTIIIIIISGSTVLVRTLAASHWRFRNIINTLARTTFNEWSARRKGLYLHRITQYRNTKTNIHVSSWIRIHDPINQAAKTYALDSVATGIGHAGRVTFRLSYTWMRLKEQFPESELTTARASDVSGRRNLLYGQRPLDSVPQRFVEWAALRN